MNNNLTMFLGGTFDPVHLGHMHVACAVQQEFTEKIHWLPCALPIHKESARVDLKHRLAMLKLLVATNSSWSLDLTEAYLTTPQSSYDTFSKIDLPYKCLLIGSDSLITLPSWHDWQLLAQHVHLIVVDRHESSVQFSKDIGDFFHITNNKYDLYNHQSGCLFFLKNKARLISSTVIRDLLLEKKFDLAEAYLSPVVWQYVVKNDLYQTT